MGQIINYMEQWSGLDEQILRKVIGSLVVIALYIVIRIVLRLAYRRVRDTGRQYRLRRTALYVTTIIATVIIARVWYEGIDSLATFAGLVAAGVAVAMQDTIANVAGWVFIIWKRPFSIGDRIELGTSAGDVIDIRVFQFSLLEIGNWVDADQSTGRILDVPNGIVLREKLANYTKGFGFIWSELPVLITFESNWKKGKQLLEEIAARDVKELSKDAERQIRGAGERYMIHYGKLTPIVYTAVKDSGVLLTIRYLTAPRSRRGAEQILWEAILDAFGEHDDLDFAYPTRRTYLNQVEAAPALRQSQ